MTPYDSFTFTVAKIIIIMSVVIVNNMPTVHIAESVFREYVDREGGYDEAKDKVKRVVREELEQ